MKALVCGYGNPSRQDDGAGRDLDEALALAIELEELCEQYWRACQLGEPVLLSATEMAEVLVKFSGYGQQ